MPFVPLLPVLGIILCGGLMVHGFMTLGISAVLFPVWNIIGAIIYFAYGYKKHREVEKG